MNTLIETNKQPRRSTALQLLAFVLLLLVSHSAMAVCSGGGGSYAITLPATTIVPRDLAVGQPLSAWTYASGTTYYSCPFPNGGSSYYNRGILAKNPSIGFVGTSFADPSGYGTFRLYSTGVAGVGMAVLWVSTVNNPYGCSATNYKDAGIAGTYAPSGGWASNGCATPGASTGSFSAQLAVRLVRIAGTLVPGSVTTAGTLSQVCAYYGGPFSTGYGTPNYVDSAPCTLITLTSTTIQVAACTTPDVKVDLGPHNVSDADLASIGSTTTAVPVNIKLNNCPAGLNAIQYRIEPNTTVVNQALSVVSLDGNATASGVGVQLLNSAGTAPFALSTTSFQAFAAYNKSTGGDYVIPLMARYYRTGNLSPGTATSSMVFTMLYL